MNVLFYPEQSVHAPQSIEVPQWRIAVSSDFAAFADVWPSGLEPRDAVFHVFQSSEFLQVWLDTIGRARNVTPCFCSVRDVSGAPVMLLALGVECVRGTRVLTFLDGGASDYNAPVLFRATPDWSATQARDLLAGIFAALPAFDVIQFEKMPATVLGRRNPLSYLACARWPVRGHAAMLTESWEEYARVHIRRSRQLASRLRRLQRTAPLAYVVVDAATSALWLERLFAQKHARFAETRVPGFAQVPGMQQFYREATRHLLAKGLVHMTALTVGGEAICIQWGLRQGDVHYYLISGFETRWRKFAPGRLLMEAMLKWCKEHRVRSVDFGVGDEAYKLEYCDSHLPLYGMLKPTTLRGHVYAANLRALDWLRSTSVWQRLRPYKWVILRALKLD